jgi:5-methylcytosine-specific restriction enzyme A
MTPMGPKVPCRQPGCGRLSRDGGCELHPRRRQQSDARRERRKLDSPQTKQQRAFYHSAAWKRIRQVVLIRDAICQDCRLRAAAEAHHIVSINEGGELLDLDNLVGLCRACHSKKTRAESVKH